MVAVNGSTRRSYRAIRPSTGCYDIGWLERSGEVVRCDGSAVICGEAELRVARNWSALLTMRNPPPLLIAIRDEVTHIDTRRYWNLIDGCSVVD